MSMAFTLVLFSVSFVLTVLNCIAMVWPFYSVLFASRGEREAGGGAMLATSGVLSTFLRALLSLSLSISPREIGRGWGTRRNDFQTMHL